GRPLRVPARRFAGSPGPALGSSVRPQRDHAVDGARGPGQYHAAKRAVHRQPDLPARRAFGAGEYDVQPAVHRQPDDPADVLIHETPPSPRRQQGTPLRMPRAVMILAVPRHSGSISTAPARPTLPPGGRGPMGRAIAEPPPEA